MGKLAALLSLLLIAPAFSGTHKVPADNPLATIRIPDKWQTKVRGELVEAISTEGALCVLVMPAEPNKTNESMGEAMRYLKAKSSIVVKAETMKHTPGKLNGMDVTTVTWEGKNQKGVVVISFTIVSIPEKKQPLLFIYWASPDAEKKYQAELDKMRQSIKKA